MSDSFKLIVVDPFVLSSDTIWHYVVKLPRKIELMAMSEVAMEHPVSTGIIVRYRKNGMDPSA